jgi:hypothetical protein
MREKTSERQGQRQIETVKQRNSETEKQRDRERQRETERDRERQTETDRDRQRQIITTSGPLCRIKTETSKDLRLTRPS